MDSHETQVKGDTAELRVAAAIRELDYTILFPFTENQRYDIAVDTGSEFLKVQIKYVSLKDGKAKVSCYGPNSTKSGNNTTFYTEDDIDGIAAFCGETGECYWIPYSDLNKYSFTLSEDGQHQFDDYPISEL